MYPIAILGAGLAGLSLTDALLDSDHPGPIVLVDRRRRWGRDRTWCTWETEELRFAGLASRRWWAWTMRSGAAEAVQRTARFPYLHIDSRTLYDAVLERADRDPRVELRTGERVRAVHDRASGPEVVTDRETFQAAWVIDALGPHSPLALRNAPPPPFAQRFLGWEVETDVPVFDPHAVTLMDFRAPESGTLTFLYVLPFSPTRALLEHTTIGPHRIGGPSAGRRRELLQSELGERLGVREWQVRHEERGEIPMGLRARAHPQRVVRAGAAGGAIRPSSGYAFSRTQRQIRALAHALSTGAPPANPAGSPRLAAMDRVFLAALEERRDHGEQLLFALARSVPGDAFARFMTDTSTVADEAQIMRALPLRSMTLTALRMIAGTHS